jgi:two-component system phosphate regulon sensor histidine kinase PhoR
MTPLSWLVAPLLGVMALGAVAMAVVLRRIAAALGLAPGLWPPGLWPWPGRLLDQARRLRRASAEQAAALARLVQAGAIIIERLPDPLLVLDAARTVRQANDAARAAFGEDIAAVLRHPVLRAAIERAYAGRTTETATFSLPVPIERNLRARVVHLLQELPDGGIVIVVLGDRSREQAVERMRADFVANASHELRTPLASLIGFIETLQGPAADDAPAQRRFLAIMAEQAQRMNRLIDDLLSLSRIEVVEHQPPEGAVDLASLVRGIAESFELRLKARHMRLTLDLAALPRRLPGDADQLAQVIQNLLDNALKYGREGGLVSVTARAESRAGRAGVALIFEDDGSGIPRADLPRLTERFYRVDRGRSRAAGGTGLGLAIVKHVLNRHRGALTIASEEGKFSRFTVWLPSPPDA